MRRWCDLRRSHPVRRGPGSEARSSSTTRTGVAIRRQVAHDDATIGQFEGGVRDDRIAFLDEFTTAFFAAGERTDLVSEWQRLYARDIAAFSSPKGTLDCIRAFARTDFRGDLEKVTVPTLVIHGDSDGTVPFEVSGKRSAEIIPGAELVVVEGAPHGLNTTHAECFNAELLRFLAR